MEYSSYVCEMNKILSVNARSRGTLSLDERHTNPHDHHVNFKSIICNTRITVSAHVSANVCYWTGLCTLLTTHEIT